MDEQGSSPESRALKAFSDLSDEEQQTFLERLTFTERVRGIQADEPLSLKMKVIKAALKVAPHQAVILEEIARLAMGEEDADKLDILLNISKELNSLTGIFLALVYSVED